MNIFFRIIQYENNGSIRNIVDTVIGKNATMQKRYFKKWLKSQGFKISVEKHYS